MTDKDEDRQLIKRILEDNSQSACTRLVNKYHGPLFQFMLERLRMETETEDLLQEVFTKVFNNLASYNPRYAFSTWLYNIANHSCIDFLRKQGKNSGTEKALVSAYISPESSRMEQEILNEEPRASEQRQLRAEDMLALLPERYQQVFEMRYIEKLKYREIAAKTGIPMGTIKTYLFRAKAALNTNAKKADQKDA